MDQEYLTTGHKTGLEGLSVQELVANHSKTLGKYSPNQKVLQTIHNHYAKKLGIPAVLVDRDDLEGRCAEFAVIYGERSNNVTITIDDNLEISEGLLCTFDSIIHETKHAHQAYLVHKFTKHGVLPKSNYEKALLVFEMLRGLRGASTSLCEYFASLNEMDAYTYEIEEGIKLAQKYEIFNNPQEIESNTVKTLGFLFGLKYQKQGINTPSIRKTYKAIKKDLYDALHGKFGPLVQKQIEEIVESGFDLDVAFDTIITKLDSIYDMIILTTHKAKQAGIKINFEKYGLLYKNKSIQKTKSFKKYLEFLLQEHPAAEQQFRELIGSEK